LSREAVILEPAPADPAELSEFPIYAASKGLRVWRVCESGLGPWWFASSMAGRFDLAGPRGTCYVALDDLGALMEFIGVELNTGIVSRGSLRKRRLWELELPWDCELADLTSRLAARWITSEINTVVPYALPQTWAGAFDRLGRSGVRYRARMDPSGPAALALFGDAGEDTTASRGDEHEIDAAYELRLLDECNIVVEDIPSFTHLSFVSLAP